VAAAAAAAHGSAPAGDATAPPPAWAPRGTRPSKAMSKREGEVVGRQGVTDRQKGRKAPPAAPFP
jgi:hypothetical protein